MLCISIFMFTFVNAKENTPKSHFYEGDHS